MQPARTMDEAIQRVVEANAQTILDFIKMEWDPDKAIEWVRNRSGLGPVPWAKVMAIVDAARAQKKQDS